MMYGSTHRLLLLLIICSSCIVSASSSPQTPIKPANLPAVNNIKTKNNIQNNLKKQTDIKTKVTSDKEVPKEPPKPQPKTAKNHPQKLTLIGYGSDAHEARHLTSFAKTYDLDFHLIGIDKPWKGFNDKIRGFHEFIKGIDNTHSDSIILILDAYDTVPICNAQEFLTKFNAFNADIVMSTGKDCFPDPNVGDFLMNRFSDEIRDQYKFLPWFLCPNSGAIMGKHDAMLSMFERVQQLVSIGNGSCNDFEGNHFSKNTQSDQRCYSTYYIELTKYNDIYNDRHPAVKEKQKGVVDIGPLNKGNELDGGQYIESHLDELRQYYNGMNMKLDYETDLFTSFGGTMFMNFMLDIKNKKNVTFRNKITNGSSCILHGNGPGVMIWRSFVKQIENNGKLYIDDWVLRIGVDFFHWILWWLTMPVERLSHWLSVHFYFDIGLHSTTFSEEVIWRWHVWTFLGCVLIVGFILLIWYKYKFKKDMKVKKNMKYKPRNNRAYTDHINHPITQQLLKGLVNLEIMIPSKNEKRS